MFPNFSEEKKIGKKGYKRIACLDEAGRGPLAGPVIAAAVIIEKRQRPKIQKILKGIKDSKKLTPRKREEFYNIITKNLKVKWAIGRVSEKVIDKINILEATKLAMKKAIKKIKRKPDFLVLDGNLQLNIKIPQISIIKADEKVFSCAVASIIAKVYRDRIMRRVNNQYPSYFFDRHKGYPTKLHFKKLKKYGPCSIHRKTFQPVTAMAIQKTKGTTIEKS